MWRRPQPICIHSLLPRPRLGSPCGSTRMVECEMTSGTCQLGSKQPCKLEVLTGPVTVNVWCQIQDKEQPTLNPPDDMQFLHVPTGVWSIHTPRCRCRLGRLGRVYPRHTTSNIHIHTRGPSRWLHNYVLYPVRSKTCGHSLHQPG